MNTKMTIADLLISGNLVEAKSQISEALNEIALDLMDQHKAFMTSTMFLTTEEIDAKFKGKTDMDFVKDAKASGEDVGSDVPDKGEADDGDGDADNAGGESDGDADNKKVTTKGKGGENITVNIKEGVIPTGSSTSGDFKPKGLVGKGAAETQKWKTKQKSLMALKKALNKTATTAIVSEGKGSKLDPGGHIKKLDHSNWKAPKKVVFGKEGESEESDKLSKLSEEQNGGNQGALGKGAWKKFQKATMKKGPKPATVDSVVSDKK